MKEPGVNQEPAIVDTSSASVTPCGLRVKWQNNPGQAVSTVRTGGRFLGRFQGAGVHPVAGTGVTTAGLPRTRLGVEEVVNDRRFKGGIHQGRSGEATPVPLLDFRPGDGE